MSRRRRADFSEHAHDIALSLRLISAYISSRPDTYCRRQPLVEGVGLPSFA